jgi:hypothetical protein
MRLDATAKRLKVRVLSPTGQAIPQAKVAVVDLGDMSSISYRGTDARGELQLDSLYGERATLLVHGNGFPIKTVVLQPIPQGELDIVLDEPHSVEVELVTPDGALYLETATVRVHSDMHFAFAGVPSGPARYRIDGLPAGEVLIEMHAGKTRASRLHTGNVPFCRIVVGGSGSITVNLLGVGVKEHGNWRAALAEPGATQDLSWIRFQLIGGKISPTSLRAIHDGSYEVWLEQRDPNAPDRWLRTGAARAVVIDAEHREVKLDLRAPN